MELAAQGGFDINGANAVILLEPEAHRGGHPQYNARLLDELSIVNLDQSPGEIAGDVQAIADRWRYNIVNGIDGPWH